MAHQIHIVDTWHYDSLERTKWQLMVGKKDHLSISLCNVKEVVNQTLLVLIPKGPHPEVLKDFRSISLCNVIYKLVTEIIANKIKLIIATIISPNQCSFVSGRVSSDNIIVAQEVIHSMKTMRGKKVSWLLKLILKILWQCQLVIYYSVFEGVEKFRKFGLANSRVYFISYTSVVVEW